jgi:hypothetical protein
MLRGNGELVKFAMTRAAERDYLHFQWCATKGHLLLVATMHASSALLAY